MNKIPKFLVSLVFVLSLASCGGKKDKGKDSIDTDIVSIWGAPATEKVLQDVHGIYDAIKLDAAINVTAAKGEYESQQIILTSKEKRITYTVELSDLKSSSGDTFSKEKIDVFHEAYLELAANFERSEMPTGRYPDALIPYQGVVKEKENFVNPNLNQGLYFRFNVALDQKPGTYTGSAKINVEGNGFNIPITLNVENISVSEVNHAKSHFLTRWFPQRGELDSSADMIDKYNRALYEYRLDGSSLIQDTSHTAAEIKEYVDLAYDHMQNPKCSVVAIPGKQASPYGFDGAVFRNYLIAFAKKSFETGYNMMKKLMFNENYVDEPQYWGPGGLTATQDISNKYRNTLTAVYNTIKNDSSYTSDIPGFKDELLQSLKDIPHVITAWYDENYAPYVDTWCPTYNYYDSELSRANYANQKEKWWYGCIDPHVPYPTYHIEDTLLSARLLSWMQAEYDVVGNLYWAVNVFACYDGEKYVDIEDYYSGSASRFPKVNGDGWLFYPGAKYGVDGPIGSLRLEAIRDGLEEYELLYEMKNNYKHLKELFGDEIDVSMDKIFSLIRSSVYYGTRVTAKNDTFNAARKVLFDLVKLNQLAGAAITDFYDDSYGNYVFTVLAPQGTELRREGMLLSSTATAHGYDRYSIKVNLVEEKNYLNISTTKDGETCDYSQFIGGKAVRNLAESLKTSDFSKETVTPTATLINANEVDASLSGKLMKVDVAQSNANTVQAIRMTGALADTINQDTDKVVFHIYYAEEDNLQFVISAKYKNNPIYFDIANINLKKGLNTIEVKFEEKDWSVSGLIDYLAVYLGEGKGQPARTFYIVDSVVYKK